MQYRPVLRSYSNSNDGSKNIQKRMSLSPNKNISIKRTPTQKILLVSDSDMKREENIIKTFENECSNELIQIALRNHISPNLNINNQQIVRFISESRITVKELELWVANTFVQQILNRFNMPQNIIQMYIMR